MFELSVTHVQDLLMELKFTLLWAMALRWIALFHDLGLREVGVRPFCQRQVSV